MVLYLALSLKFESIAISLLHQNGSMIKIRIYSNYINEDVKLIREQIFYFKVFTTVSEFTHVLFFTMHVYLSESRH